MRWLAKLALRVRSALYRSPVERELDDELNFHLEKQVEANIVRGMPRGEARLLALRMFGGIEQIKDECRDMRGLNFAETLLQDFRYGVRIL